MRRIFRDTFYMRCNAYDEEKSRDVVTLTVSTLFNNVFRPIFSSANRFIMYKVKFCIREEIEILFSTIDFLDHLPRYRRHTRYIFRGDFSKVGSFLSEAHPSFRESCSPDFLPRFLSARLLYRDLGATRIVVPLVARESFDAARHGVAGQIESSRWKTRWNSISIRALRRRVAGNATPRSFDASAGYSLDERGFPSIATD